MVTLLRFAMNDALTDDQRDIIIRRWFNNESVSEIAENKRSSRTAVYRSLDSAQKILKDRLKYAEAYRELMINDDIPNESANSESFGEQIKAQRKKMLLSLPQLADILDIQPERLSEIESGKTTADFILSIRIATFLKIPVSI